MPTKKAIMEIQPEMELIPDEQHPDYLDAIIDENVNTYEMSVEPNDSSESSFSVAAAANSGTAALKTCAAVSGRYTYDPQNQLPSTPPDFPASQLSITARVDVDRFYPQNRISIEVLHRFPKSSAHVIAEVTSDRCMALNHRMVRATVTYRDGDHTLIPGDRILFEAKRGRGLKYGTYKLTLSGTGMVARTFALSFQSKYFDPVDFEVDRVSNAGTAVTTYDTGSHENRPGNLPIETVSLSSVYKRAGFKVSMSPNTTVIPVTDAGSNGTWSDNEMHNAMITYWSRFVNRPQWALWVLYAARHDEGRSLGGIMFDDIGQNHRQGTSIFTDSFIQDAPAGDPSQQEAWRRRMVFWTAVHEMGHAFNLAHSWQKALGESWIPLANQPEARSFMNYPYNVNGGEEAFFADFRFRFSDEELLFMRHAPRRFVQMGNSDWFDNHNFEAPTAITSKEHWALEIRPNREINTYSFLEPVVMELKLTNTSSLVLPVEKHLMDDGHHIILFIQRDSAKLRKWRPMITKCQQESEEFVKPGESVYSTHMVSASTGGWLIDEPGFYKIQAAIEMGSEIAVSNIIRIYVAPPANVEESNLAPDYFTEDVGRALFFQGVPALGKANGTLEKLIAASPKNPAAMHAEMALTMPKLSNYKWLDAGVDRDSLAIRCHTADIPEAAKVQMSTLLAAPDKAAQTMGHITYFDNLNLLSAALVKEGNDKGAKKVMQASVTTMKKRKILPSVVQATERKLARMK